MMPILPVDQAGLAIPRRPLRRREQWMIGGVTAALAALTVVLVIALTTTTRPSARGCVSVSLAYSTGGAYLYRCGDAARALCAGVGQPGGVTGIPARAVAVECRRAGLRVG